MGRLADAITAAQSARGPNCTVGLIITDLDEEGRRDLSQAMDNPRVQHAAIAAGLHMVGHKVDAQTVSRHRRGLCSCQR